MPYVTTLRIIRRDRPPCRASIFELERQRNLRPFDTPHRYPLLTLILHVTVETIVTADGAEAVLLNIVRQPDANTVAVAEGVRKELADARSVLPPGSHERIERSEVGLGSRAMRCSSMRVMRKMLRKWV